MIERDYRQALKQIDAKMPELDQTIQQVNTFINQDWYQWYVQPSKNQRKPCK
ncbi:hypothetical protein V4S40_08125 [Enterococcus cecorum]